MLADSIFGIGNPAVRTLRIQLKILPKVIKLEQRK
jgi:hypothetical protein